MSQLTPVMELIISILPALSGVIATVVSAFLAISKIAKMVREFRQSNELKQNNEAIHQLLVDNQQLKKMNEKLLVELTKIKPKGWVDDDQN